jgi:uracil-DNA glycosylase
MLPRLTGKVVLLGQHVAKAFGLGRAPYFAPRRVGAADMMVLPHPSGVNKWWAKPENRKRARRFIAEFREVVDV